LAGIIIYIAKMNLPVLIFQVIGSWVPTFALFALFRKLLPNDSIKGFYKNVFRQSLNWKIVSIITIIQISIFTCSVVITSFTNKIYLNNLLDFSLHTILSGFLISLITGATGEESGWRGFLQTFLEKKFSVIKASLLIGIIWGFWHTPLWFLEGLTGIQLIHYIFAFMVWVISASIIIGICYNLCKNLFIPMWIHFLMNFLLALLNKNMMTDDRLTIFTYMAIFYAFVAIAYIVWYKKYSCKYSEGK
jgi:membrane protease YdiL (CAAX protease family)